jgi:transcriptional regulator with XRE-family HTH domain
MSILREVSGLGSRPYPLDHERRRNVLIALAEKGITLTALAKNICLPVSLISMIVNGRRRSEKTEQRIADFLGKSVDSLFPSRTGADIKKMRQAEASAKEKAS